MVLSATIRNEKGESVGTFALRSKMWGNERPGWYGVVNLDMGYYRYRTECKLIVSGFAEDETDARPEPAIPSLSAPPQDPG